MQQRLNGTTAGNVKALWCRGEFLVTMDANKVIWRYTGVPNEGWEAIDSFSGSAEVAVSENGDIYQRHVNGQIWRLGV